MCSFQFAVVQLSLPVVLWLMGGSCHGKVPFSLQTLSLGCLRLQLLKLPQL